MDKDMLTAEVLMLVDESSIGFTAGYYEWNVWRGDDNIYTFGDVLSEEEINDVEALENFVDFMIDGMQEDLREDEKDVLSDKEVAGLKEVMVVAWKNHLCLEDKAESINETLADAKVRSEKENSEVGIINNKDELDI